MSRPAGSSLTAEDAAIFDQEIQRRRDQAAAREKFQQYWNEMASKVHGGTATEQEKHSYYSAFDVNAGQEALTNAKQALVAYRQGAAKGPEKKKVIKDAKATIAQLQDDLSGAYKAQGMVTPQKEQSFWETLLGVATNTTGRPQSALPGMQEVDRDLVGGVVGGGAYATGASLANVGGVLTEGAAVVNEKLFDQQHRQQYTAAQNTLDYGTRLLETAVTDEDRAKAEQMIAYGQRQLDALERERARQTRDVRAGAESVYSAADNLQVRSSDLIQKAKMTDFGMTDAGNLLVDAGVSGVQMAGDALANAIVPGSGLAALGVRAFGSGAQEARQNGATYGQQVGFGLGTAATEIATEKMFGVFENIYGAGWLDNTGMAKSLTKAIQKMNLTPIGRTALELIGKSGEEAIEELTSGVVSPVLDSIYNGKSVGQNYAEMDPSDLLHDALVGGILGLAGANGQIAQNAAQTQYVGETYRGKDDGVATLIQDTFALDPENKTAQAAQKKLDSGGKVSDSMIRRMVEENEQRTIGADMASVQDSVAARLVELGETEENAKSLASVVAKQWANGQVADSSVSKPDVKLSHTERKALENSAAAQQVVKELNVEEDAPEWVQGIETKRVKTGTQYTREYSQLRERLVREFIDTQTDRKALAVDDTAELEKEFGKAGAELFQKAAPRGVDGRVYYHAFNTAFLYGSTGGTLEAAQKAVAGRISDTIVQAAYDAGKGRADFLAQQNAQRMAGKMTGAKVRGAGKVDMSTIDTAGLSDVQWASINALRKIAEATGINIRLFESGTRADGTFVGKNGEYNASTNEVEIDINAGRRAIGDGLAPVMLKTMGHELTHFIQENNREGYRQLKEFITRRLTEKGHNLEDLAWTKVRRSEESEDTDTLTYDEAMDEVIADACENMLKDTTAIETLAKEHWNLFKQIRNWIRKFCNAVRRAFAAEGHVSPEAEMLADDMAEVQKLWDDAFVTAVHNYQQTGMTANEVTGDQVDVKESIRESMATAGIEVVQDKDTGKLSFLINGKRVSHVTAAHIENESAFGLLIKTARDGIGEGKDHVKGHITGEEAKAQFQGVADIMNLVLNTQNPEMVWEVAGSQLFSAVKSNSDGQYGTTVDFTTVCRKTVEMITAMSHAMMAKGGGLTKAEVTELQRKLIEAGSQVPCPVCYVFSRWAGVGTILDNMYKFQAKYADATAEEIEARIAELKKRNTKAERKTIRANLAESDEAYISLASTRERANQDKKTFRAELRKARKAGDAVLIESLQHSIDNADFLAKNAAKQMNEMVAGLDTAAQELSWLQRVRSKEGYKPVPKEILFDMASSESVETFMRDYADSWAYRTTRGPSAGKAILPYSDMKLGDMIQPLKAKSSDGNKTFADPVSIKGEWNSAQQKAIINAIARVRAQNLIGGQRFQSTSDFRYDYALDYIQAFFEAQALGSNMQTYTKIIEFGEMVAKIGGDVNLSVMPRNKGYENGHLIFSSVTGIDFNAARRLSEMYDSAQLILVGINDEHIRLALEDSEETGGIHIGFVIPYHTSGASIEEFIRALVSNLNEDFVRSNYQDYSDVQTDHAKKAADVTEDQFRRRDLRKRILTGGEITAQDLALMERDAANRTDLAGRTFEDLLDVENRALAGDQDAIREYESWSAGVLQDLYDKMWTKGGSEYGVRLNSKQAEAVMPHEYWDKTTNRGTAYINGFIFRSYCYNMGLSPRFTGISSRGEVNHGNFRESRGYWKTLIDRAMYANDGSYRDQQHINLSNMPAGMISPEYAETHWGEYKVAEPDSSRAERVGREFGLSKSTFADSTTGERVQYSAREGADPEPLRNPDGSIKYVYKAFYAMDGKLYPPMVANLSDEEKRRVKGAVSGTQRSLDTPVGIWLDADIGELALDENGEPLRNTRGRLAVVNSKGGGTLAFRPGWHLGEWPDAKQFNKNSAEYGARSVMPASLVFAKCEIAADRDYQLEAMELGMKENGKFDRTQAGLPYVPMDGYYKYRTNVDPTTAPWYITGAMRVVEILDDDDCARICAEFGVTPSPRKGGKINLADYGLKRGPVTPTANPEAYRKSDAAKRNEAALRAAMEDERYSDAYTPHRINFEDKKIRAEFERNRQDAEYYREQYGRTSRVQNSDRDAEYLELAKDPTKNAARLQEMVDEAARDAGYKIGTVYHGTPSNFTVFRSDKAKTHTGHYTSLLGHFFSTNRDVAKRFTDDSGRLVKAILKDGSYKEFYSTSTSNSLFSGSMWGGSTGVDSFSLLESDIRDFAKKNIKNYPVINGSDGYRQLLSSEGYHDLFGKYAKYDTWLRKEVDRIVKDYVEQLKAEGYEGIVIRGTLVDALGVSSVKTSDPPSMYIVFDSNQIKSADPVTYDDNGDIIPLSKRFDTTQEDIRYSERDVEAISDRELLANALATVAQNPAERDILQRYQAKTAELGEIQTKLAEQRALMRDHISGAKKLSTEDLLKARNRAQLYAKQLDRADRELLKLESMGPVKAMLDREHKAYRKALKAEKRAEALRQRYNEKLTQQIEDSRQRMANYRQKRKETEARRKYKDRIKRIANDFRQMLLHPTDSRYSPVELLSSAYEIALMLDTSGEREDTKAKAKFNEQMRRLDDQYRALQESKDSDYATEYDTDFADMVTQLRQRLAGRAIRDLSVTELEDVANVLHDINEMLKQAKYQLGKAERVTNYSVGESIIQQQREYAAESRSKGAQMAAGIERLSANTMRNVRRMTGYDDTAALAQLVQDLNEGIRKKNQFSMEANKLFDRLAGKRMQQATTEQKTYSLGGTQVQMTEMQAMQLILSWEREANNDITKHLTSGGILIPNAALMKKGQGNEAVRVGTMANGITQEDITAIYESMDEWARDYMDAARYFFNVLAQNAINEATMQTKHRRIATTRNYIPFEIDPDTVAQEIEGVKFDATIEGMGMLKSVQEGAANALVIRGLDTIIQRHIEKAGQVYGLAVPIRNYNKAMAIRLIGDSRTARASLHSEDLKLLDAAVRDLQTPRTRDRNAVTKLMDRLQSAFVKSTLLSNVSVTIKQAASYSTAGLYLSQKALVPYQGTIAKLFANNDSKFARDLFAEIDEHTAAHYIRRQGMSLQEAAMIAQDQGKLTRLMDERIKNDALNPLKWIQNMDVATTAALWLATKRQVEMDGTKPGDSDYWTKVTELYNKVIEDTQPMYDVLHRPEIQRTTDSFLKSILMFKTQPLQNAGIIWDAVGQYAAAQKSGKGVAEAKAKLGRAVGSQVASLAVFAAMSFLAYAVKNRLGRYKDDEEELTVESVMKRILLDMASNSAGLVMPLFGSEAYTAIDGIVTRITTGKQAYDALSAPMLDMVNGWIKDVGTVFTHLSDLDSHAGDIPSDLMTIGFDLSALFGIPAENVYNMVRGTVGNVGDWTGHPVDWATDESNTVKGMKAAWENGHYDTAKRKMKELIQDKMDDGKTEKEAKSSLKSSMTSYLKPLYIKAYRAKDNKEMDRVRKILVECGLYDDVAKTLATWVKDI
jgi:hypothetical protein